ncbi:MAG: hypothetical protein ACC655_08705 [Rhodothermia bacterium]
MNADIRPDRNAYFRDVTWVIIIAFFGFILLTAVLLLPIYRLFQREAQKNEELESGDDD